MKKFDYFFLFKIELWINKIFFNEMQLERFIQMNVYLKRKFLKSERKIWVRLWAQLMVFKGDGHCEIEGKKKKNFFY